MQENSHFSGTGQPLMDEINRCRADHWDVTEEDITMRPVEDMPITASGKRYTLTTHRGCQA